MRAFLRLPSLSPARYCRTCTHIRSLPCLRHRRSTWQKRCRTYELRPMVFPKLFAVKQKDISLMTERRDIAGLIKALHSSDFAVQTQAAQALGSLGTAAMNELISRLKNKNKDVRF